jgi:xanthine/CO dehydrogenase XdhC/CoxF family maturation factor
MLAWLVVSPGLPATVGYLDIGDRSPQELAALVLAKLKS